MFFESGKTHHPFALMAMLACGASSFAQTPPTFQLKEPTMVKESLPQFTVVDGYLVTHLPGENVTVVAQVPASGPAGVDHGWATWTQRSNMLWRGQMQDSQGRTYNIRILPGYVAPWRFGAQGWADAGANLADYGEARTWTRLGQDSRACFRWGWEDSFWEFGLEGSQKAWSQNFRAARRRVSQRTFGWPLAYPWAAISASFETLIRVPLGVVGALGGTAAGAVVVPAVEATLPTFKAAYHAGVDGALLPISGWTWHTVAAPPAALLASAPTPNRADGVWMKVIEPQREPEQPVPAVAPAILSADSLDLLARYALETTRLEALEAEAKRLEQEELAAVRAHHAETQRHLKESRVQILLAWAGESENAQALQALIREGGDAASIRVQEEALVQRLTAMNLSRAQALEAFHELTRHPLQEKAPLRPPANTNTSTDKTDPVRGALETVDRVTGTRIVR